jgi:hypothetical protein
MREDRVTGTVACDTDGRHHLGERSDEAERGFDAQRPGRGAGAVADWQQQELLPGSRPATSRSDRPSERLRRAGLTGIAQAREALAEAARRAKARSESRAA